MTVFLMTTSDKYELPLAVADNVSELSRMTGKSMSLICNSIRQTKNGRTRPRKASYNVYEVEI